VLAGMSDTPARPESAKIILDPNNSPITPGNTSTGISTKTSSQNIKVEIT
jgi:hypothetical protein